MGKPLKLLFVLPSVASSPVGGFKVVYEYANRLSRRGHHLVVAHLVGLGTSSLLTDRATARVKYVMRRLAGRKHIASWFPVDPDVDLRIVRSWKEIQEFNADIIIATAWQTAEMLARDANQAPPLCYLIQHRETLHGNEDRVLATWHAPFHKLVIARWLQEFGESIGEQSYYLPNGLDLERFYLTSDIDSRSGPCAMMLYHLAADKGSVDGIAALRLVRERIPNLRAIVFGVSARPSDLPGWMEYYNRPAQNLLRDLYNQAQVFVAPSLTEGWGLPASEALCCGAALAATDIGGHREFAVHAENALLSPPHQIAGLGNNIVQLLSDSDLRSRIAKQGHRSIQRFTWERSVNKIEGYLFKIIAETD